MAPSSQNEGQDINQEPWFLKSSFPVFLPSHAALTASQPDFETCLQSFKTISTNATHDDDQQTSDEYTTATDTEMETTIGSDVSTSADIREDLGNMDLDPEEEDRSKTPKNGHPFMNALFSHKDVSFQKGAGQVEDKPNIMRTENHDIAFRSTTDPLLDLFTELEDVVSGPRLLELLQNAWKVDAEMTLKIIFNARSIHLGKASRQTFYRCAGWLAKNHPQTLLANLAWLSRPVIQKKVEKNDGEKDKEEGFEMVFAGEQDQDQNNDDDPAHFDVKNGVAHGYWKDLLNLLALHVNGKLDVLADPRAILNIEQEKDKSKWPKTRDEAQDMRREMRGARHAAAVRLFLEDPVYRALHVSVARLFAAQLKNDLALLRGEDAVARRRISLCAKWAPSSERFHDKHTFVVSSIAEILHPAPEFEKLVANDPNSEEQRELYLRHAREAYRKDVSALRKYLEVVERDITAGSYKNIKYDRVPSVAMNNYASIFAAKDTKRFGKYIGDVADGKAQISGATLLPSTLIKAIQQANWAAAAMATSTEDGDEDDEDSGGDDDAGTTTKTNKRKKGVAKALVNAKIAEMKTKVLEGQWNTLVQRIKDSGTLSNAIAVADISGSMGMPIFPDGTCPMDSSVGLALLIAEATQPPFGGAFITFSEEPVVQRVDDPSWTLWQKVEAIYRSPWGMSTDFAAVFERLILPMAVANHVRPEDMVKRVFVFSDMHFNQATKQGPGRAFGEEEGSYERIRAAYREAGYEMPELVFWNLAGGRATPAPSWFPSLAPAPAPVAPKPVTAEEPGTALVSGYSQGMLKVFLDGGSFEDMEEEEVIVEKIGENGEVVIDKVKRQKLDPLSVVRKAVGHRAYDMLRVVD